MKKIYFALFISLITLVGIEFTAAQTVGQNASDLQFDQSVRDNFIKGQTGDVTSFDKAMEASEKIIAAHPNDASALVWHGSGTLSLAGKAFGDRDFRRGSELWKSGLIEMDSAAKIAPDNLEVLLTRAATYLSASAQFPVPDEALRLLKIAVGDYEKVLSLGGENFGRTNESVRIQTLYGLGEGHRRLDNKEKARSFYNRLLNETKTTGESREKAEKWLADNAD